MQSLFDKDGFMRLDEIVYEMPSYKKITEDALITDEEIIQQSNVVLSLLKQIDQQVGDDDKKLLIDTISEMAVLYTLNSKREGRHLWAAVDSIGDILIYCLASVAYSDIRSGTTVQTG